MLYHNSGNFLTAPRMYVCIYVCMCVCVCVCVCAVNFYFNAAPTTPALSHRMLHTFLAVSALPPATQTTHCACADSSVALVTVRAGSRTIYLISALASALLAVLSLAACTHCIAGPVWTWLRREGCLSLCWESNCNF